MRKGMESVLSVSAHGVKHWLNRRSMLSGISKGTRAYTQETNTHTHTCSGQFRVYFHLYVRVHKHIRFMQVYFACV